MTSNSTNANIFLELTNRSYASGEQLAKLKATGYSDTYYLSVNNNVEMIRIGHSDCSATADEQKILENTIFYMYAQSIMNREGKKYIKSTSFFSEQNSK